MEHTGAIGGLFSAKTYSQLHELAWLSTGVHIAVKWG
jgi:hypothetical protein